MTSGCLGKCSAEPLANARLAHVEPTGRECGMSTNRTAVRTPRGPVSDNGSQAKQVVAGVFGLQIGDGVVRCERGRDFHYVVPATVVAGREPKPGIGTSCRELVNLDGGGGPGCGAGCRHGPSVTPSVRIARGIFR